MDGFYMMFGVECKRFLSFVNQMQPENSKPLFAGEKRLIAF